MIKRDAYGIIVQHNEDPTYADGGDSACRTGIMAMCGSQQDINIMYLFVPLNSNQLVRHPFQAQWNDSKLTSRDQVIGFFSGTVPTCTSLKDAALFYAKSWRINKDILMPADKLYLYKCAGAKAPLWLTVTGYINLIINLIINTTIAKNEEQNQFVCQCIIFGKCWTKALYKMHPNLLSNLHDYWCGWRNQDEIFEALSDKLVSYLK